MKNSLYRSLVVLALLGAPQIGFASDEPVISKEFGKKSASIGDVKALQQSLLDLGKYSGAINGKFDKQTQDALIAYRKEKGLKNTSNNPNAEKFPAYVSAAVIYSLKTEHLDWSKKQEKASAVASSSE